MPTEIFAFALQEAWSRTSLSAMRSHISTHAHWAPERAPLPVRVLPSTVLSSMCSKAQSLPINSGVQTQKVVLQYICSSVCAVGLIGYCAGVYLCIRMAVKAVKSMTI